MSKIDDAFNTQEIDSKIQELKNQSNCNNIFTNKALPCKSPSSMIFEILAGTAAGAIAGYALDKLFGTKFVFLSVFILGGFAGSFYNIYKQMSKR